MRERRWATLLVLSALLAAPPPSLAQEEEQEEPYPIDGTEIALSDRQLKGLHKQIDQDGDGKVSLSEVTTYAAKMAMEIASKDVRAMIEELDHDHDGKLSLEEHLMDVRNSVEGGDQEELLPQHGDPEYGHPADMTEYEHRREQETAKFRAADEDGDGMLSIEELPFFFYPETHAGVLSVTVEQLMRVKDSNQDGKLTPMEFWEVEETEADEHAISDEEYADFQHLDQDGDGFLCLEDLRNWESGRFHLEAAMTKLFESADKDRDMYLTLNELLDARELISISDAHYHLIEWAEHAEL